jgi:hypothetical protein
LPSGIYFCRIEVTEPALHNPKYSSVIRMLLTK